MAIVRGLRARSLQREGHIDDVTVPKWAAAFPAARSVSKYRCSKDVAATGDLPDVWILHAILGQRFAQRVDVDPESSFSHGRLAPDTCHQLPIADDLSSTRGQHAQQVELTVTQGDGPSRLLQSAQCGEEPIRTERNDSRGAVGQYALRVCRLR